MAKLRCWPGCLAYIERDRDFPENVGVMVRVLGPVEPEDDYPAPGLEDDSDWHCDALQPIRVWSEDGPPVMSVEVLMPDAQLRPITPPPGSEDIPTDVPAETEAA